MALVRELFRLSLPLQLIHSYREFEVEYKLIAFCGSNPDQRTVLQGRTGKVEVITTSDKSPRPEVRVVPAESVNITWLLQTAADVKIDRNKKSCR